MLPRPNECLNTFALLRWLFYGQLVAPGLASAGREIRPVIRSCRNERNCELSAFERAYREAPICFDSGGLIEDKPPMAKKPGTNPKGEHAFFNIVYEDDSQRSNRRVPTELLGGLDGDEPARGYIVEQDREIAEKSGRTPLAIKSISRVGAKKK
jgi:hypothetical protein